MCYNVDFIFASLYIITNEYIRGKEFEKLFAINCFNNSNEHCSNVHPSSNPTNRQMDGFSSIPCFQSNSILLCGGLTDR